MRPSRRLLCLLGLWFLWGLAVALGVAPPVSFGVAGALLAAGLAADAAALLMGKPPRVSRRVEHVLALGTEAPVTLEIGNQTRRVFRLHVHDDPPSSFRTQGLPSRIAVAARGRVEIAYRVVPTVRGDFTFRRVVFWRRTLAGLLELRRRGGSETSVRVYPNFRSLARYTLWEAGNRLGSMGIHLVRRRGQGSEFHQLRAYRVGDTPNQIHWKATSKRLQLISREYRDEQDQQIVLLLDCGRRMRARDGELSHFDHALNAVLLLAHIAVRQGDSVGIRTFGGVDRHLSPRKGMGVPPALLHATYDIQPTVFASDLAQALEDCAARIRKRTLIVLVSNVADQAPADLLAATQAFHGRHLVLFASLREAALDALIERPVEDLNGALTVSAAHLYRQTRQEELDRLRASGLACLDVIPSQLHTALASAYFAIKASRAL